MSMAITAPISGVSGTWYVQDDNTGPPPDDGTATLPAEAASPLAWCQLLQDEIHTFSGPHWGDLRVTLLDGRFHMYVSDPSVVGDFKFGATPAFLQDNFHVAASGVNVYYGNPYTAPHPNTYGLYLPRRAVDDLPRHRIKESVTIAGDGSTAEVLDYGQEDRRVIEIRYNGTERAGYLTERYFVDQFFRDHMRGGQTLRYHPGGETVDPYDLVTDPSGYHNIIRLGPQDRQIRYAVPGWYEHSIERFEFLEIE